MEEFASFATTAEYPSHASPEDIAQFRGRIVEPEYPQTFLDEDDSDERKLNRVDGRILIPDYSYSKGGGSRSKNRKKSVKRITGLQRIEKHCNIVKNTGKEAYEPETQEHVAMRQLLAFVRDLQKDERRTGRPRKGEELRVGTSGTADPQDLIEIKDAGMSYGEAIDQLATRLSKALS